MLLKYSPSHERRIKRGPQIPVAPRTALQPATCVKRAQSRPQRDALCSNQALQLFFPWQGLSYHSDGDEGSKEFYRTPGI